MKNPNQRITLTIRRPKPPRHDLIGAVKITPDAEVALRELSEQTGLPMRQIASSLITQAAACVDIIEAD